MGWVPWPLFIFVFLAFFSALWWPYIWPKMGFRNFSKKLLAQFISYLPCILMGWVSWPQYIFVFLASFSTLWWPNIWLKMGFPEFKKQNYWFHSLHTWHLPLGVSLLTPIHFRVPSLICDPLVAKCLTKMGFLELFEKNFWLNSFHTWHLPLWGESFDPYTFSCS